MHTPSADFRNYATEARPTVREFSRLNHHHQTLDVVLQKKAGSRPLKF